MGSTSRESSARSRSPLRLLLTFVFLPASMSLQENLLAPRPAWFPEALGAIGRHGFLTARQLGALVECEPAAVDAVLQGLVAEGLLQTLHPTHGPGGRAPLPAYLLTRQGRDLLRTIQPDVRVDLVRAEKSRFTLAHDLLRNEFAVVLERLSVIGLLTLLRFEVSREAIAAAGHIWERGFRVRVPLVADGFAVLTVGGQTTALLVEIDRGTVAIETMATKYRGYLAWLRDGGPARRFGLRSLRVLTVAPNETRLARLRAAALDATDGRGHGLFWFCPESTVDCERPTVLLEPHVSTARRGELLRERLFA